MIPTAKVIDKQAVLKQDEANQRSLAIQLQQKFSPISKALWRQHQSDTYLNTLSVSNEMSLANLIANEKESENQGDILQSENLAMQNLLTIADQKASEYIIDRLDNDDIQVLNQRLPELLSTLKKKYKNINKDAFIALIKSESKNIPIEDVTERGQRRLDRNNYTEVSDKMNNIDSAIKSNRTKIIDEQEQEKGQGGRQTFFEEYEYADKNITPKKKPISPKRLNSIYGKVLEEDDINPQSDEEIAIFNEVKSMIREPITKRLLQILINEITLSNIPEKFYKQQLIDIYTKLKYKSLIEERQFEGKGLKRRKILGRGIPPKSRNPDKYELNNGKFTIDLEKLRRNILSVSYSSCRASIPSLKKELISNDVKDIITDIINGNYNAKLFNKMKQDDQRLVSTFVRAVKIPDIDMTEFDKAYQNHYEILLGEINSGNNNPSIKRELKEYILRAISEGLIPKSQGLTKLFELSL
jgi:hypothetical protein